MPKQMNLPSKSKITVTHNTPWGILSGITQPMPTTGPKFSQRYGHKETIEEFETAAATETCLALMHNKYQPAKKQTLAVFTIDLHWTQLPN
ncbi:hypothetical protein GQ457_HM002080 [Hibiscus cannabinus]